jgi:voltage-gated potassium channel
MQTANSDKSLRPWQEKMHEIIYEADTPAGKLFDLLLLFLIVISIVAVMLESIKGINIKYGEQLNTLEWIITALFTLEFVARISCIAKPMKYVLSFYGIVDILSILPSYIGIFVAGNHSSLSVIRSLRLLRIFRILKLARYIGEANLLIKSLKASRPKILIFMFFVLSVTFILGTVMYIVESEESGFTSIPMSIYWAIVTLTTVGYGDIAPATALGQAIASFIMITGYAVIAVPTGIVSAEIAKIDRNSSISTQACPSCSLEGHDSDALHCKYCGVNL